MNARAMHDTGRYPGRKLPRDQMPPAQALHFDGAFEGIQQLMHVVEMPTGIDLHAVAVMRAGAGAAACGKHAFEIGCGSHSADKWPVRAELCPLAAGASM